MINTIISILTSIGIGTLFAIPGIILGYWLKKAGIAPNHSWLSLLVCVALALIRQFWVPSLTYGGLALISIAGSILGVYRMDIYQAATQEKLQK